MIIPIKEESPGVLAVVDVLHGCLTEDLSVALWLGDLSKSTGKAHKTAAKEVSDRVSSSSNNVLSSTGPKVSRCPNLTKRKSGEEPRAWQWMSFKYDKRSVFGHPALCVPLPPNR